MVLRSRRESVVERSSEEVLMNLSVLEKMVREADLSRDAATYLLTCRGECEWLDFKESVHLDNEKHLADFARDVLAFKNVGGGYMVIGVVDKTWEPIGLDAPLPLDTKLLRDQFRRVTGLDLDIDIVHHQLNAEGADKTFAVILVRSSRKRSRRRVPTLTKKDFAPTKPYGLRRGEIYIRRGDESVRVSSQADLEGLLERLEANADQAALEMNAESSPFALLEGPYRLLEKTYERFVGREELRRSIVEAIVRDPRIWIINVHGPGGVGKSALVSWAAYHFFEQRTFEGIVQLTAKDTALSTGGIRAVSRSLYSLENLLDHIIRAFEEEPPDELEAKRTLAIEILSAWSVLLVLDNMETVTDGRILGFIRDLPPSSRAKVLLTSRQKTGFWELPLPVKELERHEVRSFLEIRSKEMNVDFPLDEAIVDRVLATSGGLPLAIQWMIGRYKITRSVETVARQVADRDSPVLEFSFRNIWNILSPDAKTVLATASVFDDAPAVQQFAVALLWAADRIDRALTELEEVTLMTRSVQTSDGRIVFSALPITMSFARHQLRDMGDHETQARQRVQTFENQMKLQESELRSFTSIFERFGIDSANEKRAVILSRRAESELLVGNNENSDDLLKQARELAPTSAYVFAISAKTELDQNRIGSARDYIQVAANRATKKTGAFVFAIKAKLAEAQRNWPEQVDALQRAVEFDVANSIARHQLGVALSRAGRNDEAIKEFDVILAEEFGRPVQTKQVFYALKSKIVTLRKAGRHRDIDECLRDARDILARNPHFESEAFHFAEFESLMGISRRGDDLS